MIIFYSIASSLSIFWTIFLLPALYFNISLFILTDKKKISVLLKRIFYSSIKNDESKPLGLFFGKWFIGYIFSSKNSSDNEDQEIYIITFHSIFEDLTKTSNEKKEEIVNENISLWYRDGNYYWFKYKKRLLNISSFISRETQESIILDIKQIYNKKRNCVAFINGNPGSGKSSIAILIAKNFNGHLCKTFIPTDPGDTIDRLYNQVEPTDDCPLIILLDEFDIILNKIHNNTIVPHKDIPTSVYDKITWNSFFDDISLGLYPNLIFILTTNKTKNQIEEFYDSSYIRKGRIDCYYEL